MTESSDEDLDMHKDEKPKQSSTFQPSRQKVDPFAFEESASSLDESNIDHLGDTLNDRDDNGPQGATVANSTVFDNRAPALKKQNTIKRRETVFAGGFNLATGEMDRPTLDSKDLKK